MLVSDYLELLVISESSGEFMCVTITILNKRMSLNHKYSEIKMSILYDLNHASYGPTWHIQLL